MGSRLRTKRGLLLGSWLAIGCGPGVEPGASESSGHLDSTTAAGSSTVDGDSTADGGGSSSSTAAGSSSSGGAPLPCAWIEGSFEADVPVQPTASDVLCDPETEVATIQLVYEGDSSCSGVVRGDSLIIELPPQLQVAGEYDLTSLTATLDMAADIGSVSGQVTAGTLIITEVTPEAIVGWAHGSLEGYDFLGSFEAPYCP